MLFYIDYQNVMKNDIFSKNRFEMFAMLKTSSIFVAVRL